MISIEVFIITRDRSDYLAQALNSIIFQQEVPKSAIIKIIISDNSVSTSDVWHSQLNKICEVRKRGGSLGAIEHFNTVLSEVTADFFLMVHDDDFLAPNYFAKVIAVAAKEKDVMAIAVNGLRFSEDEMKLILPSVYALGLPRLLSLDRYYSRVLNCFDIGIPPVSGFFFSKSVSEIRYNLVEGGKHCDISFIGKVIQSGKVVQLKDGLLYVREHLSNDSNSESYKDRVTLIRYIKQSLGVSSRWWPLLVYRWQCSNRAISLSVNHRPHLVKIRRILFLQQWIGRLKSLRFLFIRAVFKIINFYLTRRNHVAFLKYYRDFIAKN